MANWLSILFTSFFAIHEFPEIPFSITFLIIIFAMHVPFKMHKSLKDTQSQDTIFFREGPFHLTR